MIGPAAGAGVGTAQLPERLQGVARAHGSLDAAVRPRRHATAEQLRRTANLLARALGRPRAEPPPDRAALLARLCAQLRAVTAAGREVRSH